MTLRPVGGKAISAILQMPLFEKTIAMPFDYPDRFETGGTFFKKGNFRIAKSKSHGLAKAIAGNRGNGIREPDFACP